MISTTQQQSRSRWDETTIKDWINEQGEVLLKGATGGVFVTRLDNNLESPRLDAGLPHLALIVIDDHDDRNMLALLHFLQPANTSRLLAPGISNLSKITPGG